MLFMICLDCFELPTNLPWKWLHRRVVGLETGGMERMHIFCGTQNLRKVTKTAGTFQIPGLGGTLCQLICIGYSKKKDISTLAQDVLVYWILPPTCNSLKGFTYRNPGDHMIGQFIHISSNIYWFTVGH